MPCDPGPEVFRQARRSNRYFSIRVKLVLLVWVIATQLTLWNASLPRFEVLYPLSHLCRAAERYSPLITARRLDAERHRRLDRPIHQAAECHPKLRLSLCQTVQSMNQP